MRGLSGDSRLWSRLFGALLFVQLVLVLATFRDYGVTYDTDWRLTYGAHAVDWYTSGFQDEGALTYWTLPNEGAWFGMCVELLGRLLPLDRYATAHLLGGLLGWGTVLFCGLLARRLAGERAGFLAALFLVLTPRFYGHAFNNPVDGPLAFWCAAATYFLVRWLGAADGERQQGERALGPSPLGHRWKPALWLAVCLGAGLGTRIGALLLVGNTLVALGFWFFARLRSGPGALAELRKLWPLLCMLGVVTWLVMLVFWPAAQVEPLRKPWQALSFATRFPFDMQVFYDGAEVAAQDLPATYMVSWFGLSLPELHLFGLLVLVVLALQWLFERRLPAGLNGLGLAIVAFAAGFPIVYTLLRSPTEYDGLRHFLFVLPLLAILIGVALDAALTRLPLQAARGLTLVLVFGLGLIAVDMARLHPYQALYFNRTVAGGLADAAERYESEYWGSSFKEACAWVVANVPPGSAAEPVRVGSNLYPESTRAFLDVPGFAYAGSVDEPRDGDRRPEVYLCVRRWGGREKYPGEVLHTVERLGAPLCWVVRVEQE